MSERDAYPVGVPCWVETLQPDPHVAIGFYRELFGWEFAGPGAMPGNPPGEYFVARLRGRDVAGVGSQPAGVGAGAAHGGAPADDADGDGHGGAPADAAHGGAPTPAWTTHVSVASAEDAAERAVSAGGRLLTGPFDAPPAGTAAVLADPAGAVFCVWEAGSRQGAALVNEPSAWAMSALHTTDPEAAKAFYGELFGWRTEPLEMGGGSFSLWRLPGYVGGERQQPVPRDVVAVMMPADESGSFWSVDFWIDDADAAAAKAAALGGSVIIAPHDIAGFRNAAIADPSGAAFSVSTLMV